MKFLNAVPSILLDIIPILGILILAVFFIVRSHRLKQEESRLNAVIRVFTEDRRGNGNE